ncbi:MAG: hypothetical protein KDJ37_01915 [Hyphomicrobiaceae bacterium]|nr:hypothetical protein [Hyphomicrobiaceae bacterium]
MRPGGDRSRCYFASMLILAAGIVVCGCQSAEHLNLPARAAPSSTGPFSEVGYRGFNPKPIPDTEMPNAAIVRLQECAATAEQREAASWVRDWFAAISKLDQCDEWAQGVLSGGGVRRGLVFILDRLSSDRENGAMCREPALKMFTVIEETHGYLATWRNQMTNSCSFERKKEASEKRLAAFTEGLSAISKDIDKFRGE